MRRIFEAEYKKSDINKVLIEQCQPLTLSKWENLLKPKNIYEYLLDGTIGTWNTAPVGVELKDYAKSVCSRPYPVPRVYEAMFRKEVNRLVSLEVIL